MSEQIRIGIVGLGRIGWDFHARQLRNHPRFALTGVADPEPERRRQAEAELACRAYASCEELLAAGELDVVVLATPTHLHEEQGLAALRHGLHVVMEKPLAPTAVEAERLVAAAQAADRLLTVYQPHRLSPYFQQLREVVESGRLGRICRAQIGAFSYSRRNDWQSLQRFGGGMLNNYGAHYIDLLLQLIGYDIERAFCTLQRIASLGDADDAVKVVLETAGGVLGEVDINQASAIYPYRLNLWGTCGGAELRGETLQIRWFDPESLPDKALDQHLASRDRRYPSDAIDWQEDSLAIDPERGLDLYENVAEAIAGEAPLHVPPEQTLALMHLLERLRTDSDGIRQFADGEASRD